MNGIVWIDNNGPMSIAWTQKVEHISPQLRIMRLKLGLLHKVWF